jgi:hypothetical protein
VRRTSPWLAFGLPAVICAAWTVYAGKDVNWDQLNYHYYLPFELLGGRLEQDFFAASAQSYLNPIGYLPFYLMVAHGWHSVAASIVLAVAHSLSIGLLYLLAHSLFAHLPPRERIVFSLLATALGAATGVFWMTVGGSFLDPLLVPPMLAGLLLLVREDGHAARRAALAGALFGTAAALKYSNAIYALAALPLALSMPGRWRACAAYVLSGALAVALLAGPWFALLMREFGNPVFPLQNAWFRSPDWRPINMIGERFAVSDPLALLAFPFRMVTLDPGVYSENFAPDLRFAALWVAAVAVIRVRRGPGVLGGVDWRVLAFFAVSLALWLVSSANGRYGMVVLLLAGVCLARVVERLLPARAARAVLAVLLLIQVGTTLLASPTRWFLAETWSRHWFPYALPERALREPALYLTVEILPMAVVAPFVHPASSFVNFRGQHSLPSDSPRLTALLERHRGHVRVLGRELDAKTYDARVRRIGYRVDPSDCFEIPWRPDDDDAISRAANWLAGDRKSSEPLSVTSCALRAMTRDPGDIERERSFSVLFDRIEKACPRLFRGQTSITEPFGSGWSRYYAGLDARLEAYGGRAILNRYRADLQVDLGALSDWERRETTPPPACR